MLIAGSNKVLVTKVVNASDGLPTISGVDSTLIWRESDGKYFNGSTWGSSPVSAGSPSHKYIGNWEYILSGFATSGIVNDTIFFDMTDSLVASGISTTAAGGEHKIRSGEPVDKNQVLLVADLIESQRVSHTWQNGEYFYMSPNNGSTISNGADGSRDNPVNTITEALSFVTDSQHAVIFLIADATASPTIHYEDVSISKRYTFIRGPGRDFIWTRSGSGDTIAITAEGVELAGFQLETAETGSGKGIAASSADFLSVHNVWINNTRGDGIELDDCSNCQILDNHFQGTGQSGAGHGISIQETGGSTNFNNIIGNFFHDVDGDSIRLAGTSNGTIITRNSIHNSSGWAVNILGGGTNNTYIYNNAIGGNTLGSIDDNGTNSQIHNNEQWATETLLETVSGSNTTHDALLITISGDISQLPTTVELATASGIASVVETQLADDFAALPQTENLATASGINDFLTTEHGLGNWVTASGISINVNEIVSGVWNEVLSKSEYNINQSAAKRLRQHTDLIIHEGTAQGPAANGNQIQLSTSASSMDGAYDPSLITLVAGTGVGQSRLILQYEGNTRIATVGRTWKVNPDETTDYLVLADAGGEHVNEGLLVSGGNNFAVLNTLASTIDNAYKGQILFLRSGFGEDQVRHVHTYSGNTQTAYVTPDWGVIPNDTTGYVMIPFATDLDEIALEVNSVLTTAHGTGEWTTASEVTIDVNAIASGVDTEISANHGTGQYDTVTVSGVIVRVYSMVGVGA